MPAGADIAGLVLAAGEARRFGGVKQLAPFWGRPLVEWPVRALRDGGIERVVVVLGAEAALIEREADLAAAEIVVCDDWKSGQSASLRSGLDALANAGADAALVVLADQPLLSPAAVRKVARAFDGRPARAVYGGRPGHPTVIPRNLWPKVVEARGDEGAAAVLKETGFALVSCDGLGSAADADTPAQLRELACRALRDGSFRSLSSGTPPRPPRRRPSP